jgi:plasmid stabilization system protein ParE
MRNFVFTRQAEDDLFEIWDFIAQDSIDAADRVRDEIRAAIRKLCEFPGIGHHRADIADPSYRFWRVYSYLLVYRSTDDLIEIVRIVSGYRDLPEILE